MRPKGIDLFKVAGIQIAIDYSWIVIFLLVCWSLSAGYFPHEYPGYGWGQYLVVAAWGRSWLAGSCCWCPTGVSSCLSAAELLIVAEWPRRQHFGLSW